VVAGAQTHLGASETELRSHDGEGGTPVGGLPLLGLIGPDGTGAPSAVAAKEPAATSTIGVTATRGVGLNQAASARAGAGGVVCSPRSCRQLPSGDDAVGFLRLAPSAGQEHVPHLRSLCVPVE
jgi:hypothetical protein